nr:hypothetical protein HK105_005477 [Polyrhizophydium stewartii]
MDTVKTRLQGQLTARSEKYQGMTQAFRTILREEGVRGLYGGFVAAATGSLLSHAAYFASYEILKAELINSGLNPGASYFLAGGAGDIVASVLYVPSEVLKTRLQLQGHFNNPYSLSAHNYRGTFDALSTTLQKRGIRGLYHGWGATLLRDVPFTAIQFTLYETLKASIVKHRLNGDASNLTAQHDMFAGGVAGVVAGAVTTPMDVIKTYLQTQRRQAPRASFLEALTPIEPAPADHATSAPSRVSRPLAATPQTSAATQAPTYNSVLAAARGIYARSGVSGLFSGVGPRMLWTGMQSTLMFVLYEMLLDASRKQ